MVKVNQLFDHDAVVGLSEQEREDLVRILNQFRRHEEEETLPYLIGDESDFGAINRRYNFACELRDELCEHPSVAHSTERYDDPFICVECGETFEDVTDVAAEAEDDRMAVNNDE